MKFLLDNYIQQRHINLYIFLKHRGKNLKSSHNSCQ